MKEITVKELSIEEIVAVLGIAVAFGLGIYAGWSFGSHYFSS